MGGHDDESYERPESEPDSESGLAVCLVSGGMDSCVTSAIAHEENDELALLHISYGQRTERENGGLSTKSTITIT